MCFFGHSECFVKIRYELENIIHSGFPPVVLSLQEGFSSGVFPLGIIGHDPQNLCSRSVI